MQQNGLEINLVQTRENESETTFTYEGYQGDKLLFHQNKFSVRKALKLDVLNLNIWDVIEHFDHADWLYSLFMEHEDINPLERYTEGLRLFIKVLNICGPPVIWIHYRNNGTCYYHS